ncbi:MAG: hypothetical protein ACOYJH_05495 [Anaerovoracaceae bacterium]|jgi:hypothetical protein
MLIPGFRPGRSGFSESEQSGEAEFCIDSTGRAGACGSTAFHFLENKQKWWGNFHIRKNPTLFCWIAALIWPDFREIVFFAGSMPYKRWNLCGEISLFQNTPPKMLIPGFRPGRSGFSESEQSGEAEFCIDSTGRAGACGSAAFHFLENGQKWWGNFHIRKNPTLFCGFAALIRADFRKIAFFA